MNLGSNTSHQAHPKIISQGDFVEDFRRLTIEKDYRIGFVLGAGASVASGIPNMPLQN